MFETGLPVFFCSCQSADFFLFYEYVIIIFVVTVWKAVAEGMISEEFMKEKGFYRESFLIANRFFYFQEVCFYEKNT